MDNTLFQANAPLDGLPSILPPYENGVFRAILTLPEANAALRSAVSAFLGYEVKKVMLRNNEAPARDADAKQERYDINCAVDGEDGDQCNVEMQASQMKGDSKGNDHRNVKWRSAYYLCHLHSNQPGSGVSYGGFVKSYQVMLCNFKVFNYENELVERFTFRNMHGHELCDAVTSIFIDLTIADKVAKKPIAEMSALVIKLHLQKKTPLEISEELGIDLENVVSILRETGLLERAQ